MSPFDLSRVRALSFSALAHQLSAERDLWVWLCSPSLLPFLSDVPYLTRPWVATWGYGWGGRGKGATPGSRSCTEYIFVMKGGDFRGRGKK
ncbi:hypothetical protein LY78DRAFT_660881, partial [Colletotrichum sublineola]